MSFFKNVKTIVSASAGAVGHATELMAEMAESLHRETKNWALRAEIKNLEFFVQHADLHQSRDSEGLRQQLFEKYDELASFLGALGRQEVEDIRNVFLNSERVEQEQALDARIAKMEARAKQGGYKLPVEEKLALSELLVSYERLFKLNAQRRTAEVVERTHGLRKSIDELEARRRRTQEESFSSGYKKSVIRFLDEKKHGLSECWYDGGILKAKCNFSSGLLHGKCQQWYVDGVLYVDAEYSEGELSLGCSVFMRNGSEVIRLSRDGSSVRLSSNLWNGLNFGTANSSSNILLQKIYMVFRLVFSYSILRSFYRARKGGVDHAAYVEYMDLLDLFNKNDGDMFRVFSG